MTIISLIAAIDENRGLGKSNQLLCHLPADLKHFKELTWGKPIIMGRKTHESIGKVLPGRLNIVLSTQAMVLNGVTVTHSLDEAIALVNDMPEAMIIGGANLFTQALPIADKVYLTLIHARFDADVFFPELDEKIWHRKESIEQPCDEKNHFNMTFCSYERIC